MTTRRYYANAAPQRTLSVSLTSSGTSATISGTFAGWPALFPYFAALDIGTANAEIVSVTNVVGSVATIVRAQDGTTGVAHSGGATLDQVVISKDFDEANAHTSSNAGVHGVSGSVVGTTDAQTLTNKTLTAPAITAPAITGAGTAALASLSTTGNATVGGTLGVTGNETVGGTLAVTGRATAPAFLAAGLKTQARFLSGQTFPTAAITQMTTATADYDTLSALNTGTGQITLPVGAAGTYEVSLSVNLVSNTSTAVVIHIYVNGAAKFSTQKSVSGATVGVDLPAREVDLNAGDVVDARVQMPGGGATANGATVAAYASILRVARVA